MANITSIYNGMMTVLDYRCTATPSDKPFWEAHRLHSVSYVRKGSFGYHARGRTFELVGGSVLVGYPSGEYRCTHEHHDCGDECLSFQLEPELIEAIAPNFRNWQIGSIPPVTELMGLGELAQAAAEGRCSLGIEEVGMMFVVRFAELVSGLRKKPVQMRPVDRRRAIDAALSIDERSDQTLSLEQLAREAGLSPFHFLRIFKKVVGITPHQFVIHSRLRRATRLLAADDRRITDVAQDAGFSDLSNFVRTFHRATGLSPARFRQASRGNRKILQE